MPRLANHHYIEIHYRLRQRWLEDAVPFTYLAPREQWDLHQFFQPYKTLGDDELIVHRQAITKQYPSLSHRAGRALKKLEAVAEAISQQRARIPDSPSRAKHKRQDLHGRLVVRSLVRPEPDAAKLAKLLLGIVKDQSREGA